MSTGEIRRAYVKLVGDLPTGFCRDAVDLRPQTTPNETSDAPALILAGDGDLVELRTVVERVTGPMTWPFQGEPDPSRSLVDMHTEQVLIERPAQLMGFVVAIDELLPDRSVAWRTRKTLHEAIGVALNGINSVTTVACRFERG
ncbi:MAG: hypothetical protein GWP47_08550 [Actinobacteria bacterium]|nr:hypothetical protein [Actinomycetota bacterium]